MPQRSGFDGGVEKIVTLCPVCQMNVEAYQDKINAKYGTKYNPCNILQHQMSVAYGKTGKESGLIGQIIKAKQLEAIAPK